MSKTSKSEFGLWSSPAKSKRMNRRTPLLTALGVAATLTSIWPAGAAERATTGQGQEPSEPKELAPRISDKFTPVEIGRVRLSGLLGEHVDAVPNRLLKGQREAYAAVFENPADTNSWRAEHIGKWLETACNAMAYSHDAKLRATVDEVVERLIKLQQPDGWLGSYAPEYRFHKYDWQKNVDKKYVPFYDGPFYDVWCHYLTMVGLIRYYETTGDSRALTAAERIGDLLIATFGPGKQDMMLINHDHGFGPGVGVFPFSKLYLLTGDVRYRDFARYITTLYGRPGKVPIIMTAAQADGYPFPDWAQIKHCEFELCLAGMCQLYRGTGDPQLFTTIRNIYRGYFAPLMDTLSLHGFKTPPPGMRVPDTYYGFLETCDIVPMLRWFVEMARITGDPQYLDALEWNLYNSLLSRDLPDGRVWPGVDVPKEDFFHCCYSMLAVGLSYIPNWVYFTTTNGLMVNLYETSALSTRVAGVDVKIKQTTEYPLDGTVKLTIEPERAASFEVLLRIPKWCQNAQVLVNGKKLAGAKPTPGELLKISRRWEPSSTVTLVLEMSARASRRQLAGVPGQDRLTVHRGPLLLALTSKLNPGVDLERTCPAVGPDNVLRLEPTGALKGRRTSSATFRAPCVTTTTGGGKSSSETNSVLLVPYAFCGVSDKPVPPPKEGVFNVYSEDGVGKQVRVEFLSPGRPPGPAQRASRSEAGMGSLH